MFSIHSYNFHYTRYRQSLLPWYPESRPDAVGEEQLGDTDLLKRVHKALLEIEVIEGKLVCPESGREFPINNGIPNMILNEDEV